MSLLRHIKRLQYIDFLIRRRSTGDLSTFSRKNKLSKRGLLNILQDMKEIGFPIKYDKRNSTYFYTEKGHMVKTLFIPEGHQLTYEETMHLGVVNNIDKLYFSEDTIFEIREK